MQRFLQYSPTFIKSELFPRFSKQNLRKQLCSVANSHERIARLVDLSHPNHALQANIWTNKWCFDLLIGKNVAICTSFHFGELISLANNMGIEIETLVVVPSPSPGRASWRTGAFAASLSAAVDAAKGNCKIMGFAGKVAFLQPSKAPPQVRLEDTKNHEMITTGALDQRSCEGLGVLASSTSRIVALPFTDTGDLTDYEKLGTLFAVSEIDHWGENFHFLKGLAKQLPHHNAALD